MRRPRSLNRSIFVKTAFLALTPIILIALLVYQLLIPEFHQRVNEENQAMARAIQGQVELFLKAPQLVLNGISAEIQALPNITLQEIQLILDAQIEKNKAFDSLYLVDSDSRIEAMGLSLARRVYREDYLGLALSKSRFINEARSRQKPYWSNTFLSMVSGRNSLALALPMNDEILIGEFSIEQLSRFIQQIKADNNLLIIITDQVGQVIAHPEPEEAARQRNISNLPIVKAALSQHALTSKFSLRGAEFIGSSLPIPAMGWTVLAAQPLSLAQRDVQAVRLILLISFLVASLLALLMSRIIATRLAAPFEQFTRSATEVSKGQYLRRLPNTSIIEVNELSSSFSAMVDAIKEREHSLQQSRKKYREVLEGTDDLVTLVDTEGKFTYVNHTARRIFGLQPEACIGRYAFDFIHPDDRDQTKEAFQQWHERGLTSVTFENRQVSLHGGINHILWSINIHRDAEQNIVELSSIGHDITSRILSEQENERLQRYLKNIIDSMPSAIIGLNHASIITQWNRSAESLFGLSSQKAIGLTFSDLNTNLTFEREMIQKAFDTGHTQTMRKKRARQDGGPGFEDITVFPLINEQVEGIVIRIDEVTEKVRMEEIVIQSEKMLSVGGLAAGMAHEINNPLAGIMQNTQVIKNRLAPEMKKNQEAARECGTNLDAIGEYIQKRGIDSMLDSVIDSGQRAARIVENMLNFSRKSESQMVPHNLAKLIDQTLELATNDYDLRKRFDFRQISIIKEYDPELPDVICEASKIQQVLLNLIKNATHAMSDHARGEPRLVIRLLRKNDLARIEIEDNGPGINETIRKRIFEPFFTTKSVGAGTGLGLSVSYFIVTENHNGIMSVESAPNSGACFIVQLPIDGGL